MKFSCEQCQTKYNLPDERVRGKVLKIRCKKCGCQITVSPGGVRTAKGEAENEDATMIGSRAQVALRGPAPAAAADVGEGEGGDSTMIGGAADFFAHLAVGPAAVPDEWHLSLDGTVVDPMPLAELATRIAVEQTVSGREIYVWREGQAEWLPPDSIAEVKAAVEKAKRMPLPAKPMLAPSLDDETDDADEGGDKTQLGSLDFAALGLEAKAPWELAGKKAGATDSKTADDKAVSATKAAAKDAKIAADSKAAAKDEKAAKASKDAKPIGTDAKSIEKDSKLATKSTEKDTKIGAPKTEPVVGAQAKAAEKESKAAKPIAWGSDDKKSDDKKDDLADENDDLLEDDALESVDAIEMDIAMPAPPPKGAKPPPPRPMLAPPAEMGGVKPPFPFSPPGLVEPAPSFSPAPQVAAQPAGFAETPFSYAAAPVATPGLVEPPFPGGQAPPVPGPQPGMNHPQSGGWPVDPAAAAPAAAAGGYGGLSLSSMGGAGLGYDPAVQGAHPYSPYGAPVNLPGAGAQEAAAVSQPAEKSRVPLFVAVAAAVAVASAGVYFGLVRSPTNGPAPVADAGVDAGAVKPKEPPKPPPEPPKVSGVTQAELNELWATGAEPVASCFEKVLKKQSGLQGQELLVSIDISEKGKPGEIAWSGPEIDDKAKKCLQKALKKWKFPAKPAYTAKFPIKIGK